MLGGSDPAIGFWVGIGSGPYPETMWVCAVVCGLPGHKCSDHQGCVPIALSGRVSWHFTGNVWYSKLDANSAYWQVKIKPEDCSKTAFITKYGSFEFVQMAFGLCNSPATYARVINLVLRGLIGKWLWLS